MAIDNRQPLQRLALCLRNPLSADANAILPGMDVQWSPELKPR